MNCNRKKYIKELLDEINFLSNSLKIDKDMLEKIKDFGDTIYVQNQITKLNIKEEQILTEINKLEQKIIDVNNGNFDEYIIQNNKDQMDKIKNTTQITINKKKEINDQKEILKVKSQKFYQDGRDADRKQKYLKKDMDRSLNYFHKICDSIPDYIKYNLTEMPNNKGYIWKNMWCMGELPEEKGKPITLFEKNRGGVLYIHEYDSYTYKLYIKKGKDRKYLLKEEKLNKLIFT